MKPSFKNWFSSVASDTVVIMPDSVVPQKDHVAIAYSSVAIAFTILSLYSYTTIVMCKNYITITVYVAHLCKVATNIPESSITCYT